MSNIFLFGMYMLYFDDLLFPSHMKTSLNIRRMKVSENTETVDIF